MSQFNDSPPPSPKRLVLKPSLSHAGYALSDAMVYEPQCKEGDTILMNYYEWPHMICFSYLKKEQGQMKEYQWSGKPNEYKEKRSTFIWTFNTSGMIV
jgi:hypothetical protein